MYAMLRAASAPGGWTERSSLCCAPVYVVLAWLDLNLVITPPDDAFALNALIEA